MKLLASNIHSIVQYAELRGISRKELLSELTSPINFSDPLATISSTDFYNLLHKIINKLNNKLLGIKIGEFSNLKSLGLIYQISLQASTFSEAMYYLQSYINTTFPLVEMNIVLKSGRVNIYFKISNSEEFINEIILQYVVTIISKELRLMANENLGIEISSPFADVEYPPEWNYGSHYSLEFNDTILKASLQDKTKLHLDVLVPEYLKLIEGLSGKKTYSSKVKSSILHMASPQLPGLHAVADNFCITPRTLQRRLKVEQTSYREIVDEQKKVIANLLLKHEKYSVADISYILGYSEPSAFIHSYQKWFKMPPSKAKLEAKDFG